MDTKTGEIFPIEELEKRKEELRKKGIFFQGRLIALDDDLYEKLRLMSRKQRREYIRREKLHKR